MTSWRHLDSSTLSVELFPDYLQFDTHLFDLELLMSVHKMTEHFHLVTHLGPGDISLCVLWAVT